MTRRALQVNEATRDRILAYVEYVWVRHGDFAGQEFIRELPFQLQKRVCSQVHEVKLRKLPLFRNLEVGAAPVAPPRQRPHLSTGASTRPSSQVPISLQHGTCA